MLAPPDRFERTNRKHPDGSSAFLAVGERNVAAVLNQIPPGASLGETPAASSSTGSQNVDTLSRPYVPSVRSPGSGGAFTKGRNMVVRSTALRRRGKRTPRYAAAAATPTRATEAAVCSVVQRDDLGTLGCATSERRTSTQATRWSPLRTPPQGPLSFRRPRQCRVDWRDGRSRVRGGAGSAKLRKERRGDASARQPQRDPGTATNAPSYSADGHDLGSRRRSIRINYPAQSSRRDVRKRLPRSPFSTGQGTKVHLFTVQRYSERRRQRCRRVVAHYGVRGAARSPLRRRHAYPHAFHCPPSRKYEGTSTKTGSGRRRFNRAGEYRAFRYAGAGPSRPDTLPGFGSSKRTAQRRRPASAGRSARGWMSHAFIYTTGRVKDPTPASAGAGWCSRGAGEHDNGYITGFASRLGSGPRLLLTTAPATVLPVRHPTPPRATVTSRLRQHQENDLAASRSTARASRPGLQPGAGGDTLVGPTRTAREGGGSVPRKGFPWCITY